MPPQDPMEGHSPNLTTSSPQDPRLPRDPNQPVHKKPRVFIHRPNEDPEEENVARDDTSLISAARTINTEDFSINKLGKMPCFRDAMLPSIGGGVGLGILRFIIGGSMNAAVNWTIGPFLGISLITYNMCQSARRKEKENIRQAVKVLNEKQRIKDAEAAKQKEQEAGTPSFWSTLKFW